MIKGLIFDMDGLLFDTERLLIRYWRQAAQELGYSMEPKHALTVRSLTYKLAEAYLKRELGTNFDYQAVRNRRRELVVAHIQAHGLTVKPGIPKLLQFCRQQQYIIAVATATKRQVALEYLKNTALDGYFKEIIGGDSIQNGKPSPDIYLAAAKVLSLNPDECIALEDSPNGILSAFYAGCRPVMIPDLTQPDEMLKPFLYQIADKPEDVMTILQQLKIQEGEIPNAEICL